MIWKIIAFILVVIIAMVVTCLLLFRAQFDKLERQVEEEYQKLYPVMEKRRDILASFFSADRVAQLKAEEAVRHSLLTALEELSGDSRERAVVLKNHALLSSLLADNTWQELEGSERVLAMEEDYLHDKEPLQLAIHTYNVLRQVFPASFVAKLLKKEPMVELK